MSEEAIFADSVERIHYVGGMVRMEFATVSTEENSEEQSSALFRVIMPPQGMLSAFNTMKQLADKLVENGIFRKNEPVAADAAPQTTPAAEPENSRTPETAEPAKKTVRKKKAAGDTDAAAKKGRKKTGKNSAK